MNDRLTNPVAVRRSGPRPKKIATIRFRVTEDELAVIQMAAAEDGAELDAEYRKRGLLSPSTALLLRNPTEWSRQTVLNAAIRRLHDRKMLTPWERRDRDQADIEEEVRATRRAAESEARGRQPKRLV